MAQPTTWLLLAFSLLASAAIAQPQPPVRQRQDRRASLPTTPAEPMLELYVAANNLTTAAFNGILDRESLVVDKTRFKWAEVSDRFLLLEPVADLGLSEKLIVKIGFKDRALPAQAVLAVVSRADVVDGKVEVDRRANTPEALLAALTQKEAELEELQVRCKNSGPTGLVLSQWLTGDTLPVRLRLEASSPGTSGLMVVESTGYPGAFSALVSIQLRSLPGQKPWAPGPARITSAAGISVQVLSTQMNQERLAPGEEGLVVVEMKTPPWQEKRPFRVELVDDSGQRRLSFNLIPWLGRATP